MNALTMANPDDPAVETSYGPFRAVDARAPAAKPTPRDELTTGATQACILLVDDDDAVRETLADLLDLEGYRVLQAADAQTALDRMQGEQVDLLITDLSMPGSDGVSLIRQGQAAQRSLPAILLTGYAEEPGLVSAGAGTQFHVLSKPVEANYLLDQISLLLRYRQA